MGLEVTKVLHVLDKSTTRPVNGVLGEVFEDGFGNKLMLVFHQTPTVGIAVSAGAPVGYLDGQTDGRVTGDLSQSDARKVAGASMVAITAPEALAGVYHYVLVEGNFREYKTGGNGVPLGNSNPGAGSFIYERPFDPIDTIPFEAGGPVDTEDIFWSADNEWNGSAGVATQVAAGLAIGTEASATPDSEIVNWKLR